MPVVTLPHTRLWDDQVDHAYPVSTVSPDQLDILEALLTPQPTWKLYGAPEAIYTICQQLADGRYLPPAAEACARDILSLAGASGWGGEYCPSCYVAVQDGNDWYEGDPDLFVDEDSGVTVAWTYGSGAGGQSSCGDCGSRGYVRNPVGEIRSMVHPRMWAKNGFTPDELGSFL